MPEKTIWKRLMGEPIACNETFPLNASGIELCSERIDELLTLLGVERQNRIRIRFSLEESMLRLRERFGEKETFTLKAGGSRFRRPFLQIEMEGDVFNPLSKTATQLEDWSGSLLTAVGLSPLYSYSRGKNTLRLNLPRNSLNAALKMLIALLIGIVTGLTLRSGLSEAAQLGLVESFLMPLYDFWVRMLTVLSGPVIFLMVCTSVLNTRTIEEEGGSSRRVFLRYFLLSMMAALLAVFASELFSGVPLLDSRLGIDASEYWQTLLKLMPDNVVSPLMQSNTPQLLLLAFLLGGGISALGERAVGLDRLVRQGEAVGLLMTESVSRCVPVFAAILICMEIISNNLLTFSGLWGVLVLAVLISAAAILAIAAYVSKSKGVRLRVLLRKLWPAFSTEVRTGSLDVGYGNMERDIVERLGIERHFATVSLPYGLVLLMPVNVVGTLMFTVFAAMRYQVEISVGWLLIAMVLSVVLFVATPPVPGANLLAYIMIFAQLHIPSTALIDAMIFDIIFGIFASAANQSLVQMELILQADKLGLLNRKILIKEP